MSTSVVNRNRDSCRLFYVYRLTHQGETLYIGKGCNNRLRNQRRDFKLEGEVIWETLNECDALKKERELIRLFDPRLNRCPGGNGARVRKPYRKPRKSKMEREIEQLGSRVAAAQMLLRAKSLIEPKTYALIKAIAYSKPLSASLV